LWLLGIGGAVAAYFASKPKPAPLSIYPEFAYTAQTSMAMTPKQRAAAARVIPTPLFSTVQQEEQAAILSQCAGSYPPCTPLAADTQLGF
jgi:hypothetical protein